MNVRSFIYRIYVGMNKTQYFIKINRCDSQNIVSSEGVTTCLPEFDVKNEPDYSFLYQKQPYDTGRHSPDCNTIIQVTKNIP